MPSGIYWRAGLEGLLEAGTQLPLVADFLATCRRSMLQGVVLVWRQSDQFRRADADWIRRQAPATISRLLRGAERVDALVHEIRQSLREAGDRPSAVLHNIIDPPTPLIGRDREIVTLRQFFDSRHGQSAVALVSGVSGVGKSHLALKYAGSSLDQYDLVWWIPGQLSNLSMPILQLADALDVENAFKDELTFVTPRVVRKLQQLDSYLLIFDDVFDEQATQQFMAANSRGHLLVTSQSDRHACHLHLSLPGLTPSAASNYLSHLTGGEGNLPVGLATMGDGTIRPIDVQDAYRAVIPGATLAGESSPFVAGDVLRVLRAVSRPASTAVELISLTGRDAVPARQLLATRVISRHLGVGPHARELSAQQWIGLIEEFSLADPAGAGRIRLHDVTREKIKASLSPERIGSLASLVAAGLLELVDGGAGQLAERPRLAELSPHCYSLLSTAAMLGPLVPAQAELAVVMATYWNDVANRRASLEILPAALNYLPAGTAVRYRGVLELARAQRHVADLRSSFHNYAQLLLGNGAAEEEVQMQFAARAGMARVLLDLGRPHAALTVCRQALHRSPSVVSRESLLLRSMLGRARLQLRQKGALRELITNAKMAMEGFGEGSGESAWALDDLGSAHILFGETETAMTELTRALAVETELNGTDHPRRAWTLLNLSAAYHLVGADVATSGFVDEAHSLQEAAVPSANPDLLRFRMFRDAWESGKPQPLQSFVVHPPDRGSSRDILRLLVRLRLLGSSRWYPSY